MAVLGSCAPGYENIIDGSKYCYKIGSEYKTFNAAKDHCKSENATLLEVNNNDEKDKVTRLILHSKRFVRGAIWLGMERSGDTMNSTMDVLYILFL